MSRPDARLTKVCAGALSPPHAASVRYLVAQLWQHPAAQHAGSSQQSAAKTAELASRVRAKAHVMSFIILSSPFF
jgi:hypothetical protein